MRKTNFKIVGKWKIWFTFSLAIIILGLGFMATKGLNMGIDFAGGTSVVIEMGSDFNKADVDAIVKKFDTNAVSSKVNGTQLELRSQSLDTENTANLVAELKTAYKLSENPVISESTIGAAIGAEQTSGGIKAVLIASLLMLLYISFRFRFNFALAAIIALIHDILITLSVYAIFQIPLNTPFIAAVLTILGYSINDTIVIFDRIRENLKSNKHKTPEAVADQSINQSITRSINTLATTLFTIVAVYVFVPAVRDFALPITIGIISGGYSSTFIASPIWTMLEKKTIEKHTAKKKAPFKAAKAK
jgi:preprotein translocase SecF subunit